MEKQYQIGNGSRYPLGSRVTVQGVNFSIISRHATRVELRLYADHDSPQPFQVIELDPETNRTYFVWHVFVEELPPGVFYTWRMDGPGNTSETGLRFDGAQDLLDPWARAVTDTGWNRRANILGESRHSMRARVLAPEQHPPREPRRRTRYRGQEAIIYELHVGGFTLHPSSGVDPSRRGTFSGVIDKIPYLKSLGITHVELMPVMAFDSQHVPEQLEEMGLENFWGYSTHSFFSPHPHYCETPEQGTQLLEFRAMVDALHDAGIDVILDVVFNHTAEAGQDGTTINFKGIANDVFYHLDPADRSIYRDYTGCGNTVNCNHPVVSSFLVNCLEFWAAEMDVDGFRFDLASVLARGEDGAPMESPPVLWAIELSGELLNRRIIAEAWDAAGLYQLGNFPGYRWAEWNGGYRDVIRRFVRGETGMLGEVATRICGSSDYYQHQGRHPFNSINFVTCHDGYTLWDLVSYNHKHNLPNGEQNRDGHNDNLSWNCGWEGATDDPDILALRRRQARNFMAIMLLSQGVPLILAGDEVLRSQRGNNNAWCQNNELGWFDWSLTDENADMLRFTREMIALRRRHPSLQRRQFLKGTVSDDGELPDIRWDDGHLQEPAWDDPVARMLGFTLAATQDGEPHLHVMMNPSEAQRWIDLPALPGITWQLAVDTAGQAPADIYPPETQAPVQERWCLQPRSVVVMEGYFG
jgi:glycogen operon protein